MTLYIVLPSKRQSNVTPFEVNPLVNYQGDLYIGKDGARYEVMRYPDWIDPCGFVRSKNTNVSTSLLNKGENGANISQRIPLEPQAQKINPLDWLFENFHVNEVDFGPMWTSLHNMRVFKVSQDDPLHCPLQSLEDYYPSLYPPVVR